MSWQERLASLRSLGYHQLALRAGLSIWTAAKGDHPASQDAHGAAEPNGLSAGAAVSGAPWPGQGGGADPAAVSQALLSLLKGHIVALLGSSAASEDAEVCPFSTLLPSDPTRECTAQCDIWYATISTALDLTYTACNAG